MGGASSGPVKIPNMNQTGATYSLITILRYCKMISPTNPFKALFQCVHFYIGPNFGNKMWKRPAVRLHLKIRLELQKLHICIYFLNLLAKGVLTLFSEFKKYFFLISFFTKNFSKKWLLPEFSSNWGYVESIGAFWRRLNDLNEWKISTIDNSWAPVSATFSRFASNSFYSHLLATTWLKFHKNG